MVKTIPYDFAYDLHPSRVVVSAQVYNLFMEDIEWIDDWEAAMAKLAHSTLLRLAEGDAKTQYELGRFASKHSEARAALSSRDSNLLTKKLGKVALMQFVRSGFAATSQNKY